MQYSLYIYIFINILTFNLAAMDQQQLGGQPRQPQLPSLIQRRFLQAHGAKLFAPIPRSTTYLSFSEIDEAEQPGEAASSYYAAISPTNSIEKNLAFVTELEKQLENTALQALQLHGRLVGALQCQQHRLMAQEQRERAFGLDKQALVNLSAARAQEGATASLPNMQQKFHTEQLASAVQKVLMTEALVDLDTRSKALDAALAQALSYMKRAFENMKQAYAAASVGISSRTPTIQLVGAESMLEAQSLVSKFITIKVAFGEVSLNTLLALNKLQEIITDIKGQIEAKRMATATKLATRASQFDIGKAAASSSQERSLAADGSQLRLPSQHEFSTLAKQVGHFELLQKQGNMLFMEAIALARGALDYTKQACAIGKEKQ